MVKDKNILRSKESYYVCNSCGALSTYSDQIEAIMGGGLPYCYCEYDAGRVLNDYEEISKEEYVFLGSLFPEERADLRQIKVLSERLAMLISRVGSRSYSDKKIHNAKKRHKKTKKQRVARKSKAKHKKLKRSKKVKR